MPVCLSLEQVDEGILERVSPAVEVREECGSEKKSSCFMTESSVTAPVSVITALIKSDYIWPAPTSPLSSTSSSSSIPHGQASAALSPSPNALFPTTTSSGFVIGFEPQNAPASLASSEVFQGLACSKVFQGLAFSRVFQGLVRSGLFQGLPGSGLSKATVGPAGKPLQPYSPIVTVDWASPGSQHQKTKSFCRCRSSQRQCN